MLPDVLYFPLPLPLSCSLLELAGGSVHALSYQQARNNRAAVGQVYVAEVSRTGWQLCRHLMLAPYPQGLGLGLSFRV